MVGIKPPGAYSGNSVWEYNGNADAPTFRPSVLTWYEDNGQRRGVCHSFVTDGNIQFLDDCMHALAGKTVPLPDYPQPIQRNISMPTLREKLQAEVTSLETQAAAAKAALAAAETSLIGTLDKDFEEVKAFFAPIAHLFAS